MEIQGKIIAVLPMQSGEGKNGLWKKQEYVLETTDQYPKKICFNFWGDKIDQFGLQQGDFINLSFDVESREYNGRWYTDVKGWKAEKVQMDAPAPETPLAPPPGFEDFPFSGDGDSDDDLPF